MINISTPLTDDVIEELRSGDKVKITGTLYIARDAAHKRFIQAIDVGKQLPFDPVGQIIFYAGPAPAKPGQAMGSVGPTTSNRMDPFTPKMLELGLKGMIGKGPRSQEVRNAIIKFKAIYFAVTGGIAAMLADRVKRSEIIAYEDLGAEAVRKIEVEEFPVIVVNDILGSDAYEIGQAIYRNSSGNQTQ